MSDETEKAEAEPQDPPATEPTAEAAVPPQQPQEPPLPEGVLKAEELRMLREKYKLFEKRKDELTEVEAAFVDVLKANLHKDLAQLLNTALFLVGQVKGLRGIIQHEMQGNKLMIEVLLGLAHSKGGQALVAVANCDAVPEGTKIMFGHVKEDKTGKEFIAVQANYPKGWRPGPGLVLAGADALRALPQVNKRGKFIPPRG